MAATTELSGLQKRIDSAPRLTLELRRRLDSPPQTVVTAPNIPLRELVSLAQKRREELNAARDTLKQRERTLGALTAGGASLGDEIGKRQRALRDAKKELAAVPAGMQPPALQEAHKAYMDARMALLAAQLAPVPLKLANYEQLVKLAELERAVAVAEVARLDAGLQVLERAVELKRASLARDAIEEAEVAVAATANLPAAVAKLGQDNAALREQLQKITLAEAEVVKRLRDIERSIGKLDANLASMRARVKTVGTTPAIGRLLRRRLEGLPTSRDDFRRARQRRGDIERATDLRIDVEERRRDLTDLAVAAKTIVEQVPDNELGNITRDELEREAATLLAAERDTLGELDPAYGRYLTQLTTLDAAERRLSAIVAGVSAFARQQLLWIASGSALAPADVKFLPASLDWLLSAQEATNVLDEPKPNVTFAIFGDNALQLELRCYLQSMDFSLAAKTELHDAIYDKLNAAGIGIAFPQRDVHLSTAGPLDIRLRRER